MLLSAANKTTNNFPFKCTKNHFHLIEQQRQSSALGSLCKKGAKIKSMELFVSHRAWNWLSVIDLHNSDIIFVHIKRNHELVSPVAMKFQWKKNKIKSAKQQQSEIVMMYPRKQQHGTLGGRLMLYIYCFNAVLTILKWPQLFLLRYGDSKVVSVSLYIILKTSNWTNIISSFTHQFVYVI